MRILFVCTGNTCRSPMAAALLNREAEREEASVSASSAGTDAAPGQRASELAISTMKQMGVDITSHRSRLVSEQLISEADLALAMTSEHVAYLTEEFPMLVTKIDSICGFVGMIGDVSDPMERGLPKDYSECAERLFGLVRELVGKLARAESL